MPDRTFDHVTIEKVQRSDLGQLENLFATAFAGEIDVQQIKRRIRRTRQFYYILQPLSKMFTWVKNHFNVYVIKIDKKVVGFIQLSYLNHTQLHIDYIAFSKPYRGQGLGSWVLTKLLKSVADENHYDVVLEVRVDNPAYSFYKRLGFKMITEILHYETSLKDAKNLVSSPSDDLPGFRELTGHDRGQLYRLYKDSLPRILRQVVRRNYEEFNPSMLVRNLDRAKNYLMRKQKTEYVVEREGKLVALLSINSYLRTRSHIISLIIHHSYEYLRPAVLGKAINLIKTYSKQGVVSTTIYSDDLGKQLILEQLGFKRDMAYYLMVRPSPAKHKETITALPHNSQSAKKARKPFM